MDFRVPYAWYLTNACIVGTVANQVLIEEMNTERMLRLEFVDSNLLSLTTSLPPGQFAIVSKGAPAQIFEQEIDESTGDRLSGGAAHSFDGFDE